MADDKRKRGAADRRTVAGQQSYELDAFCRKHGLTRAQGRALIAAHGNSRRRLDAAAEALKAGR